MFQIRDHNIPSMTKFTNGSLYQGNEEKYYIRHTFHGSHFEGEWLNRNCYINLQVILLKWRNVYFNSEHIHKWTRQFDPNFKLTFKGKTGNKNQMSRNVTGGHVCFNLTSTHHWSDWSFNCWKGQGGDSKTM